jgi:hypothetical protein
MRIRPNNIDKLSTFDRGNMSDFKDRGVKIYRSNPEQTAKYFAGWHYDGIQSKFMEYNKGKYNNRYPGIFDRDTSLYMEALFELDFIDPSCVKWGDSFKPQWGLNIGSFLKDDSPGGIRTKELWMEEISINFALTEVNKQKGELEEQLRRLHKKY